MKNFIFDLDNTLYSPELGLLREVRNRINHYMINNANISADSVDYLREKYRDDYGITLCGLMKHHNVDPEDYLDYVHDIDYDGVLKKDEMLRSAISKLDGNKIVFTNGSKKHAESVIKKMGIEDLFSFVVAIEDIEYVPKPSKEGFYNFIKLTEIQPENSILFEDSKENLKSAMEIGFKTAFVWGYDEDFDYNFKTIYDIEMLSNGGTIHDIS